MSLAEQVGEDDRDIAPRGDTVLLPGDHLYVFCKTEDLPLIGLLFGQPEE